VADDRNVATDDGLAIKWPVATPENRAQVGCYSVIAGNGHPCWCGYSIARGFGQCPECRAKQDPSNVRRVLGLGNHP